ncbi:hypothetical protein COCSUDRAFT_54758 [Coccomyxa subellipsoidea C-169]|uniref:Uncharacterized protein n=1 Tax=Coccomyxa subellipsoidea (strain C-169) TaxID=574566 RepID=I0YL92_COCSC|nr:hypothetical protein COCSUDRAFT_54758 [Coccomyxa subellipsoidea C-169]EIE19161.1 hypothetical protein COCSUDRAFT_54758 [Coccomyxa subellipsoidea C-169]|eukprot:XP_005643705.1 hypothetical protein COCSUDRAFT_54758 [Coccomyxa subellipsoidea C-169]
MAQMACKPLTSSSVLENNRCSPAFSSKAPQLASCRNTPARQRRLTVRAEGEFRVPTPPKRVTQPPVQPEVPPAKFGFVESAERLNSRAAMLGFFGILLVEALAGKGIFEMAGFTVGNGLGFEF